MFATAGVLVASENLTVMVSPSPNTASSIGAGSTAFIDVINGPCFCPNSASMKTALNIDSDASDVPASFVRPPSCFTVIVNGVGVAIQPV